MEMIWKNQMSKKIFKTVKKKKRSYKDMQDDDNIYEWDNTENDLNYGNRHPLTLESPVKKRRLSSHLSLQLNNAFRSELRNTHHPQVSQMLLQMQRMLDCNIQSPPETEMKVEFPVDMLSSNKLIMTRYKNCHRLERCHENKKIK